MEEIAKVGKMRSSSAKEVSLFDVESDQQNEQRMEDTVVSNESCEAPEISMVFDSLEDLFIYYKFYGKQEGFGVVKTRKLRVLHQMEN